ncbi:MAG: MerR family transcriptional regulator [Propionibacteriaceae bacterium]|jgi:DNA-binding transcriptional MerR regulator|nr:MerR family transcriptional regulator [Propionibacteriaceae bacterium]
MNTYSTSEMARLVGVTPRTIQYWANYGHEDEDEDIRKEKEIQRDPEKQRYSKKRAVKGVRKQLLPKVTRRESFDGRTKGKRIFTDDDLVRCRLIKNLQDSGLGLEKIAVILSDPSHVDLEVIVKDSLRDIHEQLSELEEKARNLRTIEEENSFLGNFVDRMAHLREIGTPQEAIDAALRLLVISAQNVSPHYRRIVEQLDELSDRPVAKENERLCLELSEDASDAEIEELGRRIGRDNIALYQSHRELYSQYLDSPPGNLIRQLFRNTLNEPQRRVGDLARGILDDYRRNQSQ